MTKKRVGVYVDYSNVYSGARDAFGLTFEPGYRGNVNPDFLAKRVALQGPGLDAPSRRDTHELAFCKVFRGAPDPGRDPRGALMEAKRAAQWERWGCGVFRNTLDYRGNVVMEKGVDVRLATALVMDSVAGSIDVAVIVSADKDYRFAIIQVREDTQVEVEVAIWQAIPGGAAIGRIEVQPERPDEPELPFHPLTRRDFGRLEDKIDYRGQPVPEDWKGPVPSSTWRPGVRR